MYELSGELAQRTPPVAVSTTSHTHLPVISSTTSNSPVQHVKGVGLGVNQVVLTHRRLVAACDSNIIQVWQQQTGEGW